MTGLVGCGPLEPGGTTGVLPGELTPGVTVPLVGLVADCTVLPASQGVLEPPGAPRAVPRKLVDSASGLPLVFASPKYTRTTTRFMVEMLVSK